MTQGAKIEWRFVRWIAHRCGGDLAPENSLSGLDAAAAAGYRAVEFDVMLSADGNPWVIHDDSLERTTFASGEVGKLADAELAAVDISRGWTGRFRGERLPRFDAVLSRCQDLDLMANVEIKPYPGQDRATGERVAADLAAAQARAGAVLLSSFSLEALLEARRVAPSFPRALLFEQVPDDWRQLVGAVAASAIHCDHRQASWSWLQEASSAGLAVRAYTVNDPALATALFALGVDGVFTDALGRVGPE